MRKNMTSKLLSVALAAAMTMGLAACGNTGDTNTNAPADNTTDTTTTDTTDTNNESAPSRISTPAFDVESLFEMVPQSTVSVEMISAVI